MVQMGPVRAEARPNPEEAGQLIPDSGTDPIDSSQGDAGMDDKGETGECGIN